jgi:hypothetical protein
MEQAAAPDAQRSLAALNLFGVLTRVDVQGYDRAVARVAYTYQVEDAAARVLIDFLLAAQASYSAGADVLMLEHCRAYDQTLAGMSYEVALDVYRANEKALNDFAIRHYADLLNDLRREFDRELVRRIDADIDQRLVNGEYGDLTDDPEDLPTLIDRVTELCAAIRTRNGL